jgi:putative transposase
MKRAVAKDWLRDDAGYEAVFRFSVVSKVEALVLGGERLPDAVRTVAEMRHRTRRGVEETVSVRSVYRWTAAHRDRGLSGLEHAARPRTKDSDVLSDELLAFLRAERTRDEKASIPELIRRAAVLNVIPSEAEVSRSTAWRSMLRMDLPTHRRPTKHEGDCRRFAYPNRMMMMLSDGKRFRAGAARLRRVAIFFLDDATRYGLHVIVGTEEDTTTFLLGLHAVITKYGFMSIIYLDNGPGFASDDTIRVIASLGGVFLINGTAGYPEGHGKIERFNQTAISAVLRSLDGAADVDPCCGALTLRLQHFISVYNQRPHESLHGDTPHTRWHSDPRALRLPENRAALDERFILTDTRSVSKDHVIRFGGEEFEVPRGRAQERIPVRRNAITGALSIIHDGDVVRLHPVDKHQNAIERRAHLRDDEPNRADLIPKTAATLAYERDYGPIVGPDGGFSQDKE